MPREKKFVFLPVRNEDLRRRPEEEEMPYVRLQKPGSLVFPHKTLEYFGLTEGEVAFLKFYIDTSKRALAFKFVEKMKAEEIKDHRTLKIHQNPGMTTRSGQLSITAILRQFGEWQEPAKCELGKYSEKDEYIHFGELHYLIIPKPGEKDQVHGDDNA